MASKLGTSFAQVANHRRALKVDTGYLLLLENIPTLHRILDEIVDDWRRAYLPKQTAIEEAASRGDVKFLTVSAFSELQPTFLKCLFSYALFFVVADRAYAKLYEKLNAANRVTGLHVKHLTPPKSSAPIQKVKRVRDHSLSHPFSQKRVRAIEALGAAPRA